VVGALLMEHIKSEQVPVRIGSILGLGIAFANSKRAIVLSAEPGCIAYELREVCELVVELPRSYVEPL